MVDERDEGFTLIELLVVIIIIGILASIAVPVYLNQRQKGYDAQVKSDLREAATTEEAYLTDYFTYATQTNQLMSEGWHQSNQDLGLTVVSVHPGAGGDGQGTYCLRATSTSGKIFYFDSGAGGISFTPCT